MKTYIYPENLRATVKLWFWNVRDFLIICTGVILSAFIFAKLFTPVPMAMAAGFAFITIRAEDTSILDYRLEKAEIKRMLGLYFGTSISGDSIPDEEYSQKGGSDEHIQET